MPTDEDQREKILKLLQTAEALASDLGEPTLAFLIERTIDECRASFVPPQRLS